MVKEVHAAFCESSAQLISMRSVWHERPPEGVPICRMAFAKDRSGTSQATTTRGNKRWNEIMLRDFCV